MKFFYYVSIFGGCVFLLSSCIQFSRKKNEQIFVFDITGNKDLQSINIDIIPTEKELYYSSVFKKVKTIILETKDECLIGSIDGMQVLDNELFILDEKTNSLLVFDKSGHFIRKIGSPGQGPGEYLQISDFTIDPLKKEIYLLDSPGKIYKYNINTGELIISISLDNKVVMSNHIQYHNGKLFLDAIPLVPAIDSYLLREIDPSTGNQRGAFLNANRYNYGWNHFARKNNESFFYSRTYGSPKYIQLFMDTIVAIDNEQIIPFLALESNNWVNAKDIKDIKKYMEEHNQYYSFDILQERNKAYYVRKYFECKNLIFFEYVQGRDSYTILFNIANGKVKKSELFLDDLLLSEGFFMEIFACSDANGIYAYIPPNTISLFLEVASANLLSSELDKRDELMKLPVDTNPIIFYYEFK